MAHDGKLELGRDPSTGQFASIKDVFPKHQQEEGDPEHLEWRAPEAPWDFRNPQASPEDIAIARENIGELYTDEREYYYEWNDPHREERWREEQKEMAYDRERFEATGHYRGRAGETFVCTHQQFEEWDKEAWRQGEFDKLFGADPSPLMGHDPQDDFLAQLDREAIRQANCETWNEGLSSKMRGAKVHGERQLGIKRKTKEMRRFRKAIEEMMDLDNAA